MPRPQALLRSLPGRIALSVLGLGGIAVLAHRAQWSAMAAVLSAAAPYFPFVVLLEGGMLACESAALWLLYGPDRHRLRPLDMARAAVIGYQIMFLLPMGRAAAEAMRAGLLTERTSGARAAAAAARMQGVLLLANACVSVPCALAALALLGPSLLPAAVAGNAVLVSILGTSLLYGARRAGIGKWLGRKSSLIGHSGHQFDQHLGEGTLVPPAALLLAFAGRLFQTAEYTLLLVAVGANLDVVAGFVSEAIHLVGAALGDLIPGQLGATETAYTVWAKALALSSSSALAIPILGHLSQMCWVLIGSLVALLGPALPTAPAAAPAGSTAP